MPALLRVPDTTRCDGRHRRRESEITKCTAGGARPGGGDSVKILRILWEVIFPFDIVWLTPEQQAVRKLVRRRFSTRGRTLHFLG
jgi:hypothetical protein